MMNGTTKPLLDGNTLYLNRITYPFPLNEEDDTKRLSFAEILDTAHHTMEKAFIASYVWDPCFVCNHFPPKIPISVVCHWAPPKKEGKRTVTVCAVHGFTSCTCGTDRKRDVEVIHPHIPENIEGNMHCKILIMFYTTHVRIVITSANLQERDWDALSQVVWVQDFVKKENDSATQSPFGDVLVPFIEALGATSVATLLKTYDFSTAKVKLLSSVPGIHKNQQLNTYGHLKLRSILKECNWPTEQKDGENVDLPSFLDYQTASVGAVRKEWLLNEYLGSLLGKEPASTTLDLSQHIDIRILFPTHTSVATSTFVQGGRTMCCWDKSGIARKYLFNTEHASRPGVLIHSKVMMRSLESNPSYGWIYAGSHNLSSSAWGRIANGGLQINNYELGVLFFPPKSVTDIPPEQSLERFSLPFDRNPVRYAPTEKPWLIPKKPKQVIMASSKVAINLYVLPQKHIFIPKPEAIKVATGANVILPPQPCINIVRFGNCKYGTQCRYSHTYSPIEITGNGAQSLEACRYILDALSKNPFSVGATISMDDSPPVQGWLWKVTEQWRYTMFVPDLTTKNPLSSLYNMDVLLIDEPENFQIDNHISDLCFTSGAGLVVVGFKSNWTVKVDTDQKESEIITTNYTKLIYIFGTKNAIKTAVSDIYLLLKKPHTIERKIDEKHIEHEYHEKEELIA